MNTSHIKLNELKHIIEDKLQHTYLDSYIQKPVIDDSKLLLLSSIIQHTTQPKARQINYIVTTMLVQIALDTHDTVIKTTKNDELASQQKVRQLSVLAGDYYSGLYYMLLAETEDYDMIQVLATAIREINELKMTLYYTPDFRSNTYKQLKQMDALLIVRVNEYLHGNLTINMIEDYLLFVKLSEMDKSPEYVRPWQHLWEDDITHNQLEQLIQIVGSNLLDILAKVPPEYADIYDSIREPLHKFKIGK